DYKTSYVIIDGELINNNLSTVNISGNGFEKEIFVSEDGSFSDTLFVKKNDYYSLRIGRESSPVYLRKGGTLTLMIDIEQFDESLTYSGSIAPENNYLAAKYLVSEQEMAFDKVYVLSQEKFILEVNKIYKIYTDLLNASQGISEEFKQKEYKEIEFAHINNIENYEQYYQYLTKDLDFKAEETLYKDYKDFNFYDTEAYETSNAYKRLLESHYQRIAQNEANNNGKDLTLTFLETINNSFSDGSVKEQLMFNYLRYGMKANEALESVYKLYKSSSQNSDNLSKVSSSYKVLTKLTPGKPSPKFIYKNYIGGMTGLEDLAGKIVYIDVWATWCGPCLREIPALKSLENDYHNKNIAFVSLSIDEKKDYQKWRTMIADKELTGIQLMADNNWNSSFVTSYGIKGIPRFILIDTVGNIINSDAPRPSNPEIRKILDELL
ncbi:TlpA family protein disulfide reductase, partial [Flavobacteriaceae bacterium]|nr:TlpA family protein disulfide reductase [Flavobacteriaceae bacterium]